MPGGKPIAVARVLGDTGADVTLWLWLFLLPGAIGAILDRWSACLAAAAAYVVLFSLNSAVASIGEADASRIAWMIGRDDLMILAVALASHGLRRELLAPD